MNGVQVSTVASATATVTEDAAIGKLFDEIKRGKWIDLIEKIRAVYARAVSEGRDPKKPVEHLKRKLPGVMWSGRFSNRKTPVAGKLLAHSGLLCADLDELGERLGEVRIKLVTSPHLVALFRSPTGNGLKAVFRVAADGDKHLASFRAVEQHVHELTAVKIDPACKDVSRLCFVSYDLDLWLNLAEPLEITGMGGTPALIRLNTESCITASLHDCIPTSLHNKAYFMLANIKASRDALESLAAKHPGLARTYKKIIEPRYQAQAHARNGFIVQAVKFAYHAVAAEYVEELLGCFYDCNRALFNDSREQHMKETKAMIESVAKTYIESLSADERSIYNALPGKEPDAFRICRDLALLREPERDPLTFFLSFNELGDRLGISPTPAQRIMRQLESYGLIKLLKKGTRRAAGVRSLAGTYQWLLMPEKGQNS